MTAKRLLLAGLLSATAAACAGDKPDPIFANTPMGPDTKALVKQLPDGLVGDTEHARHTGRTRVAPSLLPEG